VSFILDALRKSDQQRQRSATPTLASAQSPAAQPGQPALLWYGLIAAVLLGAGILIGWLQQTPPQPLYATLPPVVTKPAEAPGFTSAPRPAFVDSVRKPEIQATPANPVPNAMPPATAAAQAPTTAAPPLPLPAAVSPAAREVTTPVPANAAADPTRESAVLQLAELPPAIQQEIPKLSILAHSYSSKPKARFVFINDQMMHEEDYPAPGLKLEQITPDGMVFNYKGYRFRRTANSDIR
jgi:general secretion pathway protein B